MKSLPWVWGSNNSAAWAVYLYLISFSLPLSVDVGLLALFFLGGHAVLTSHGHFPVTVIVALGFLASIVAMGTVISVDPQRSLQLSLALLPAAVICLLVSGCFRQPDINLLYHVLAVFTIATGGWLLIVALCHPDDMPEAWIGYSRLTAFRVPNDVVIFPVFLPFFLVLWRLCPGDNGKWLALTAILIAMIITVLYRSRLSVLVAGITISAFYLGLGERRRLMRILSLALVGVLLIDVLTGLHLVSKLSTLATASSRLPLWLAAWQMFLDAPWTGHGVGSFLHSYRIYMQSLPVWVVVDSRVTPWAHNLYLEILAELGVGGLLAFACFFGFPWRLWKDGMKMQGQKKLLNSALMSAFVGFCVGGFLEFSLWRQWVGLTFLLLVGCIAWQNNHNWEERQ